MQIEQSKLFYLLCASFLAGVLLALFYDFLYMTRLWLLPSDKRYTLTAIQKLRKSRVKKKSAKKRIGFQIALFFGDVFFCIIAALTLILLLYWFNDGAFRAVAPLCVAFGFLLFRATASKGVRIVLQWLAFGVETVLYMLLMPFKRLFAWMARAYRRQALKQRQKRLYKQRRTHTKQEIEHIERAAHRLIPDYTNVKMQKGEGRARKSKKTV
jgi:hypothetical protein